MTITKADFDSYISFALTRNVLHENPQLAEKEGIKGTMLPGRSIISRAEGEMTHLPAFSDSIILLSAWTAILLGATATLGFLAKSMQEKSLE